MLKKILSAALAAILTLSGAAFASPFPEPDWGALLKEKRAMSGETVLSLYAEASPETAPYYGARLEPRAGTYLGMITETSESFAPMGSYLTYFEEMQQDDIYYPANRLIEEHNAVVTIGWSIYNLDQVNYDQVRTVLDNLAAYNKPMFIRFANEMNVSSLGDNPEYYKQVFRNVANMVHEYPNFATVWSPNDMGALDRPFQYFYPGDEYVDWIGISSYMKKYFQGRKNATDKENAYFMTGDYAWTTNAVKPILKFMKDYNIQKPLMISEGGVATNNQYGEDLTAWASPRLRNMMWYLTMRHPEIKLINYFNNHRADEIERFDLSGRPFAEDIFRQASECGSFLRSTSDTPEFIFQPANDSGTLNASSGTLPLYTLAYTLKQPEPEVHYYVDGAWTHVAGQIPYRYDMDVSALSDGAHTLTIKAAGKEQSYTFYKRGGAIRFGAEPDELPPAPTVLDQIRVLVNDAPISFDQPPVILEGRTLVPVRAIFDALGATIFWDETTQTVTATQGDRTVILRIGSNIMLVNQTELILDVPAQLINDRTLVPARAVAEAFLADVGWDETTQTVLITTP